MPNVGDLHVNFTGDTSDLRSASEEAQEQLDSVESSAESAGDAIDDIGVRGQISMQQLAAAASVVLSVLRAVSDQQAAVGQQQQDLLRFTGSPENQQIFDQLLARDRASSIDELNVISSLVDPLADDALQQARQFQDFSIATGIGAAGLPAVSRTLDRLGIEGARDQGFILEAIGQRALTSDGRVSAGELVRGLEEYESVLSQAGLTPFEQVEFLADIEQYGRGISRAGPALNQFIRGQAEAGVTDIRGALEGAFGQITGAPTAAQSQAIGQDLFGAEGGLGLVDALLQGNVGLGDQLLGYSTRFSLEQLAQPTASEEAAAIRQRLELQGPVGARLPGAGPIIEEVLQGRIQLDDFLTGQGIPVNPLELLTSLVTDFYGSAGGINLDDRPEGRFPFSRTYNEFRRGLDETPPLDVNNLRNLIGLQGEDLTRLGVVELDQYPQG